jgi:predicted DNA-binding transcriptional regulator AlpA
MLKDELLNITELAKQIGRDRSTIWRWVRDGELKPRIMGKAKVYSYKEAVKIKHSKKWPLV